MYMCTLLSAGKPYCLAASIYKSDVAHVANQYGLTYMYNCHIGLMVCEDHI